MLAALIDGQRDPAVLAESHHRQLPLKIPALTEALTGRFTTTTFLARVHLDLIDRHTAAMEITARIEVVIEPFRAFRELICTIPGIGPINADVIVAETGADMTRFPTAAHLASWAGTTPGHNESAGRVKSSRTRPGNPYLQGALGAAAMACAQNPNTYLGARYRRIAARRGPQKANVAIQRTMLTTIWHMGTTGTFYDDPGADYFTRLHPERAKARAIHQLRDHGIRGHARSRFVVADTSDRETESSRQRPCPELQGRASRSFGHGLDMVSRSSRRDLARSRPVVSLPMASATSRIGVSPSATSTLT